MSRGSGKEQMTSLPFDGSQAEAPQKWTAVIAPIERASLRLIDLVLHLDAQAHHQPPLHRGQERVYVARHRLATPKRSQGTTTCSFEVLCGLVEPYTPSDADRAVCRALMQQATEVYTKQAGTRAARESDLSWILCRLERSRRESATANISRGHADTFTPSLLAQCRLKGLAI